MSDEYLKDLIHDPTRTANKDRTKYCIAPSVSGVFPAKSETSLTFDRILFGLRAVSSLSEDEMRLTGALKDLQQTQLKNERFSNRGDLLSIRTEEVSNSLMNFINDVSLFRRAIGRMMGGRKFTRFLMFIGLWAIEQQRGYIVADDIRRFRMWKKSYKATTRCNSWVEFFVKQGLLVEMSRIRGDVRIKTENRNPRFFLSSGLKATLVRAWGQSLGDQSPPVRIPTELVAPLRREAGYSQRQFCKLTGIDYGTLSKIEAGFLTMTEEVNSILIDRLYFLLPYRFWTKQIHAEVKAGIRPYPWHPEQVIDKNGKGQHFRIVTNSAIVWAKIQAENRAKKEAEQK